MDAISSPPPHSIFHHGIRAKAKKRVAKSKKSSKRGKTRTKPARKMVAKRTTPKKAKSKLRQAGRGALKSAVKKKRLPKTGAKMAPREVVEVPVVEDTIIDVIDEPVPGVVRVTEYETIRMTTPKRGASPETEE